MRVFVKYNNDGQIQSASKVEVMPAALDHPFDQLGEGEAVLEVPDAGDIQALDPLDILNSYKVDTKKKKLVKQGG